MEQTQALRRVRSIFPDLLSVPYVPTIFRASNPPAQAHVEVFKTDPPIPNSDVSRSHSFFHTPVAFNSNDDDETLIEDNPLSSSDSEDGNSSRFIRKMRPCAGASLGPSTSGEAGASSIPSPSPSPTAPTTSSGPVRKVLRVPSKLVVKRAEVTATELKLPTLEPLSTRAKIAAPEPEEIPERTTGFGSPIPQASDAEELGDRSTADAPAPSSRVGISPPEPCPVDTSVPEAFAPNRSNEFPVGLIEDDLLSADLCNGVIESLRRASKHFKKVVERSQLKSSVLAVKAEELQDVCSLKQDLAERDALIAELKEN